MNSINPTVTALLDQKAKAFLEAAYKAWKIDQHPLAIRVNEEIRPLPREEQHAAMDALAAEPGVDMGELVVLALESLAANESRQKAYEVYCQARLITDQMASGVDA